VILTEGSTKIPSFHSPDGTTVTCHMLEVNSVENNGRHVSIQTCVHY